MARIFISYCREDIDFARHLKTLLQAERFDVWLDERSLGPGDYFSDKIQKAIDRCLAFVVIMSPRAVKSEWVKRELARAQQKHKPVLPVLLEGAPWDHLESVHYADMTAGLRTSDLPFPLLKRLKRLRIKHRLVWLGRVSVLAALVIALILIGLNFLTTGEDEDTLAAVPRVLFMVDASVAMSEPLPGNPEQTKWQTVWPRLQYEARHYSNRGYDVGMIVYGPPVSFSDQQEIGVPGAPCDDFEWRLGYQGAYALDLRDIGLAPEMDLTGAVALEAAVDRGITMGGSPDPLSVILFFGGLIPPDDVTFRDCNLTAAKLRDILDRLGTKLPEGTELYLIGLSAEALDLDNLSRGIHVYSIGEEVNLDQALNEIEEEINQSIERRKDVATRQPTPPGATQPHTPTPPQVTPTLPPPTPIPPGRSDTVAPLSDDGRSHTPTADTRADQPTHTGTVSSGETAPPRPESVSPSVVNTVRPSATAREPDLPVPTRTTTPTGTRSPSATSTITPLPSATRTGTPSPSSTPTITPSPSVTRTGTVTSSATPTITPLLTFTLTPTATPVPTSTSFVIPTSTPRPTFTPVPTATRTRTPTVTPSWTPLVPTAAGLITPAPGDYIGSVCGVITSGVGVNVRAGPGDGYTRIGGLAYGADVSVDARSQGWSWIYHNSVGNGWVASGLIAEGDCKDMAATATRAKENPPTRPPQPTDTPVVPGPTAVVPTLPPGVTPTAGPPPTSGPPPTAVIFNVSVSIASVGQFKPAPDGPNGHAGCNATVAITVTGADTVSGVLCIWNASYTGDGDCGYPVTASRGTITYQVTFGGDENYRDHQVRFRTDSYGTFGPAGGRCSD